MFSLKNSGLDLKKETPSHSNPQSSIESENPFLQSNLTPTNAVISTSSDDAEEYIATGETTVTSSDLEMIADAGGDQIVGLRFTNLNIPQCAPINSAYIQFFAKGDTDGACNLTIYGEANDNAVTFSNDPFNISSRTKTSASITWSPNDWEMDLAYQTIDISPVIQEIVERVGYTSNSSIAIIIEGTGLRRAYSFDGNNILVPAVFIDYDPNIPDDDNDGTCDANDLCPGGAEPDTPCDDGESGTYNDMVQGDCSCAGTWYDCPILQMNYGDSCDDGLPETSNDIIDNNCECHGFYDCQAIMANFGDPCDDGIPDSYNDMIDSTCTCVGSYDCDILQMNFGDPCNDGESGTSNDSIDVNCNCVGVWDCPALELGIGYPCDDGDPNTSSDIVDENCNCGGLPLICSTISSSSDDAEEQVFDGDISLSSDLEMINDDVDQIVGLRFNNIEIPQCAVITNATIQFTSKGDANIDPCNLTFYGDSTENALTFSNEDYNISSRTKTAASVTWNPALWENGNETGVLQQTVDLSSIVQEIVNMDSFVSGNSIAFIIEGTGLRRAYSFDDLPDPPPVLCIEFNPNYPDSDNDGVCDANDLCNGGPGEPGTLCDDGDPLTVNDFVNDNCECVGGFECVDLMADFGTPCDDNEPGTFNDIIDSTCTCVGTWECEVLMTGFGYPCDDGDPNTFYDAVDSTCTCIGVHLVAERVAASNDDAEEEVTGPVDLDSDDLEMVIDDTTQIIGIRFKNLGIPHCAVINRAYIQFRSKTSTEGPCDLEIYGEDSDHALAYIDEDLDISSRFKTNSMVTWSPNDWSSNDVTLDQQTPDLTGIVQEIIERPGFTDTSSIAFIIEGSGLRRAYSYDAGDSIAPMIYIEYFNIFPDDDNDGTCNANDLCDGPEPGTPCDDGILETYDDTWTLDCECEGTYFDCPDLLANIGDECDDGDINTPNDFIDSTCVCVGGFDCPELMLDFGAICDDSISGTYDDMIDTNCNCVGIWECPELMAGFNDPCDDGDSTTLDDMISSICECEGSPTVFAQISSSSDDAEEKETGQMSLTSSDLELVYDGNFQKVGLRFTNLNIPNKARIDTAFIQFTNDEILIDPGACDLTIYGENVDNAQTYVDVNGDISAREKTSASVEWSPEEWLIEDEADSLQRTGNLKAIVKEIVNRPGFNESSSIAFIIEGTGTRTATSFDGKPENAPVLYVRYDLPLGSSLISFDEEERILVYPVPTTNYLNISFNSKYSGDVPIQIIDLNGRLLYSETKAVVEGKNEIFIDELNLNNGIYFIQLFINGNTKMKKFVIFN